MQRNGPSPFRAVKKLGSSDSEPLDVLLHKGFVCAVHIRLQNTMALQGPRLPAESVAQNLSEEIGHLEAWLRQSQDPVLNE